MDRKPRQAGAPILSVSRIVRLLVFAVTMAIGTLGLFLYARETWSEEVGLTMAFTTFVLFQMVNVFNARSETESALSRYSFTNAKLWAAVGVVVLLQVLAVTWGPLRSLFDTEPLDAAQFGLCVLVALSVLVVEEVRKLAARLMRRSAADDHDHDLPAVAAPSGGHA
jgi:Ca2+-transporting ATPase